MFEFNGILASLFMQLPHEIIGVLLHKKVIIISVRAWKVE